jgi:hypothetical protein
MTAEHLKILIQIYAIFSVGLAVFYLSKRRLSLSEWFLWGMVTLTIPILGPFVAISARPGPRKRRTTWRRAHRPITGDPKGNSGL